MNNPQAEARAIMSGIKEEQAKKLQALIDAEMSKVTDVMLSRLAKAEMKSILRDMVREHAAKFVCEPARQVEIRAVLDEAWGRIMDKGREKTIDNIVDGIRNAFDRSYDGY